MQFDFNDNYANFISLGSLPIDVMEYVYARGWPVTFSAWVASVYKVPSTVKCLNCIAESYTDWSTLRRHQQLAAIPQMTDVAYFSLIKYAKQKSGWVDMPRILFFTALDEVRRGWHDPTKYLLAAARSCKI
jgi:hypothetical protein